MFKVLAKYDIRGIQSFVFRTNKLREIRKVSDLPEKIISETAEDVMKRQGISKESIDFIDIAGGNALAVIESKEIFEKFSSEMAKTILEKTYSLKLVYAFVECTDSFCDDYNKLNKKLGRLKSSMPEACHTGAFPICRQDYLTGFPIAYIEKQSDGKVFITKESSLKLERKLENDDDSSKFIDDYIIQKGIDSHIAVIHIDGNSMGNRLNEIISKNNGVNYNNVKEKFKSISIRDSFKEVCDYMKDVISEYARETEVKYLSYAVIQAGDDITYITRADIALPFTKLFLNKISEKYMYKGNADGSGREGYEISACAGIAFVKSHFPFSDAYELAERCCASAKKRAKENKNNKNGFVGNWVDFEVCSHIKNIDLGMSRRYNKINYDDDSFLMMNMRPYCVGTKNYSNEFFDYEEKFERRLTRLLQDKDSLNPDEKMPLNRSRAKELRKAYFDGRYALENFNAMSASRNYKTDDLLEKSTDNTRYAAYYDAIEIMDIFNKDFNIFVNDILKSEKGEKNA